MSKIRVQTCCRATPSWQQWQGIKGRSAHQLLHKATLDGVVFIMRSTGSSFMHMAAATPIRKGTELKPEFWRPRCCPVSLICTGMHMVCLAQGQPSPHFRRQSNSSTGMMTRCNQPQICCASSAWHTLLVTLQEFLQVFYLSSVQVPC